MEHGSGSTTLSLTAGQGGYPRHRGPDLLPGELRQERREPRQPPHPGEAYQKFTIFSTRAGHATLISFATTTMLQCNKTK